MSDKCFGDHKQKHSGNQAICTQDMSMGPTTGPLVDHAAKLAEALRALIEAGDSGKTTHEEMDESLEAAREALTAYEAATKPCPDDGCMLAAGHKGHHGGTAPAHGEAATGGPE